LSIPKRKSWSRSPVISPTKLNSSAAGGIFDVRREAVSPGHWFITKLKVNMNGKALIFKTIAVQQDEIHSHFQPIPDSTTLHQAEALAQKQSAAEPSGSPAA